jgi:glycolate oxidase iron-sulfur subunit
VKVAYQDACHLAHAQGVRAAPRSLLASIPGVELTEPAEWQVCCGSAGTYNIDNPAGAELGERKARVLAQTNPDVIATGNIGCMTQIRAHLRKLGHEIPLVHTMQLLDRAYERAI